MSARMLRARASAQDGLTLIEVLVTSTLAVIVLFAVLSVTDVFTSGSAANTRLTDAQDRIRTDMGALVRDLRDAPPDNLSAAAGSITPIIRAAQDDVVFRSPRSSPEWLRYCVGPNATTGAPNDALRVGRLTGSYTSPGSTCPAGSSNGWTYGDMVRTKLNSSQPTITYSCAGAASATACDFDDVRTVVLSIAIEHNTGRVLRLTSAVTPRNRG